MISRASVSTPAAHRVSGRRMSPGESCVASPYNIYHTVIKFGLIRRPHPYCTRWPDADAGEQSMSDKERTRGMALAALAAGLFAALPLIAHAHSDAEDGHAHGGINGKCVGGNSCKGQSACKSA